MTSMRPPAVTVILPVFNAAATLPTTLKSLLHQDERDWLLVAVDDGSTDESGAIIRSLCPTAVIVTQANAGPAAARNVGLRLATGRYVAFLDADDLWPPDKLARQRAILEARPSLDVVMGRVQYQSVDDAPLPRMIYGPEQTVVCVHLGAGLFRRSVFASVGEFAADLRYSEDHDWFLRARERGVGRYVEPDAIGLVYRVHSSNMTAGRDLQQLGLPSILKRSLDRRRASSGQARELPGAGLATTGTGDA